MQIRDRIKELRRVRARDLVANPKNWRTHPAEQRDALQGVLAEVGYADALLVRDLPNGKLEIIDGHLRAETTPDAVVPVLVLDVSEQEALQILLTHDPLSALAEADHSLIEELLELCSFDSEQVKQMLDQVELDAASAEADIQDDESQDCLEVEIPSLFQVVVQCDDEDQQRNLYEQMRKEGYRCRVLTL